MNSFQHLPIFGFKKLRQVGYLQGSDHFLNPSLFRVDPRMPMVF